MYTKHYLNEQRVFFFNFFNLHNKKMCRPIKDQSDETIKTSFPAKHTLVTPTLLCSQKMQVRNNCQLIIFITR